MLVDVRALLTAVRMESSVSGSGTGRRVPQ